MYAKIPALWRFAPIASLLLVLGGCDKPVMDSTVEPEIVQIGPFEYPYDGLKLKLDPKGYGELAYKIERPGGYDPKSAAESKDWVPAKTNLSVDFTPKHYTGWLLTVVFKHQDGTRKKLQEQFHVGLPPWHADRGPVQFVAKARYTCLLSEDIKHHSINMKTVLGFELELGDLPGELDKSMFTGFAVSAPAVAYNADGQEIIAKGVGGGLSNDLEKPVSFATSYVINDVDPYPLCTDLDKNLEVDWKTARVTLLDKYLFPVAWTTGRVLGSRQVDSEEITAAAKTASVQ